MEIVLKFQSIPFIYNKKKTRNFSLKLTNSKHTEKNKLAKLRRCVRGAFTKKNGKSWSFGPTGGAPPPPRKLVQKNGKIFNVYFAF